MFAEIRLLYRYRDLLRVLVWKNLVTRYQQSYLGLMWVVLRPLILVGIFIAIRTFVGIDSGDVPYGLLAYCAMVPWAFFQEAATDGVGSIVNNANLVKKIYFPREIFPLASLISKLVDLSVSLGILALLMLWYQWMPTVQALWLIPLLPYGIAVVLSVSLLGGALNVFSRDISQGVPLLLSLGMFVSPIMYPLELVKRALLERQVAGEASELLYDLYIVNPMVGVIDTMQRCLLMGQPPDWAVLTPGALLVAMMLPLGYVFFKRAEGYFADVI